MSDESDSTWGRSMIASEGDQAVKAELFTLARRIREEFEEVPGLRITVGEAARFWGLDETTCEQVLERLLADGFLARGVDERYGPA